MDDPTPPGQADNTKYYRVAWSTPTGKTGHGKKWTTLDIAQHWVICMNKKNTTLPAKDRYSYSVETRGTRK